MERMPQELVMDVLCFVPPTDLLANVSRVSHKIALLLRTISFWEKYSDLSLDRIESMNFTTLHQWQRACLFVTAVQSANTKRQQQQQQSAAPKYLHLGSVLVRKNTTKTQRNELYCVATTTDHRNEMIENVLIDRTTETQLANDFEALPKHTPGLMELAIGGLIMRMPTNQWWSSKPTAQRDTNETLVLCTKYPQTLISDVNIKPLRDPYDSATNKRVFAWSNTIIKAYQFREEGDHRMDDDNTNTDDTGPRIKVGTPCSIQWQNHNLRNRLDPTMDTTNTTNDDNGRTIIEGLLAGQTPVYESSMLRGPPDRSDEWERYIIPDWVVANVITITLIGKKFRQFDGTPVTHHGPSGYYACVEGVFVRGIPIHE